MLTFTKNLQKVFTAIGKYNSASTFRPENECTTVFVNFKAPRRYFVARSVTNATRGTHIHLLQEALLGIHRRRASPSLGVPVGAADA